MPAPAGPHHPGDLPAPQDLVALDTTTDTTTTTATDAATASAPAPDPVVAAAGAPGPRRAATATAVAGDGLDALPEPAGGGAGERRGRPRSAAADTAIVETVLRLLEEGATVADLSMERIAREAGVGKATVYRRWSGKPALMLDVMQALDSDTPAPTGASVRDDLVQMLESMRRRGLAKRQSALVRTVLTQVKAQPELWDAYHTNVIQKRQQVMREILTRGMASGEIRADEDVDFVAELFVGPMLSRVLLHEWQELPEGLAERIVDTVLDGVRPHD
ncbi:TetR/AcrR family transcriptional regulator [Streptomyces sp. 796.1]|uniref:TetR/AcrR family transcriptional regulator n=1 Tax=Streptomyces sp. 796.1 TaxID=3163029 RepID=UPI0039C934E3